MGVVAVATRDPFDHRTFSGYSRNLFSELRQAGVDVSSVTTRDMRLTDYVSGAVNLRGVVAIRGSGRGAPRINPKWFWSRRGFERASRRFDEKLMRLNGSKVLIQIGTHVRTSLAEYRSFCITDATAIQAVDAGQFSISQAPRTVVEEAIENQREVFNSCEKIFTLSAWAARSVVDDYGQDPSRVVVLGAGANVENASRSVSGQHTGGPYVLFVGLDWEQKGGPLLLEAFRHVRTQIPDARLVVVGCEPSLDEPGVEVVGRLDRRVPAQRDQLFDLYREAGVLSILPRFDAFPNVLLEAGWWGIPVVGLDVGSRREVVLDGVTGLLASTGDAKEVGSLLTKILSDPDLRRRMGMAARRRIDESFTWEAVSRRLMKEIGIVSDRTP